MASKIDKLIQEMCPEGVEYQPLSKATELTAGDRIIKSMMSPDSEFPVMGGGDKPTGRYSDYNFEHSVTISRAGSAGSVNWIGEKFWATDVCFISSQSENGPDIKFVYYWLSSKEPELKTKIYGGNLPKLNKQFLWDLPVPILPLEIQKEIVKVLDNFTGYSTELRAELRAELQNRIKQYQYYRNELLSFGNSTIEGRPKHCKIDKLIQEICPNGVEYCKLSEVCDVLRGKRLTKSQLSEIRNNDFNFPVLHGGMEPMGYYNEPNRKAGTTIVINTGNAGNVYYCNEPYWSSDACFSLYPKDDVILDRFLYYFMATKEDVLHGKIRSGAMPTIDATAVESLMVPVPPLEIQKEIVKVLDAFDTVCSDIRIGLPAEIIARQKQYEYYRDKLLTFREKA